MNLHEWMEKVLKGTSIDDIKNHITKHMNEEDANIASSLNLFEMYCRYFGIGVKFDYPEDLRVERFERKEKILAWRA